MLAGEQHERCGNHGADAPGTAAPAAERLKVVLSRAAGAFAERQSSCIYFKVNGLTTGLPHCLMVAITLRLTGGIR